MSDKDDIISAIATSLRDFRINHPTLADGSTRNDIYEPNENTIPWAEAIIDDLQKAGFQIIRPEK